MDFNRVIKYILASLVVGFVLGTSFHHPTQPTPIIQSDTIYTFIPTPKKRDVVKYVYLPKTQLLFFRDTVQVPIERVVYKEKEFEATIIGPTIGGHKPMLESFTIHRQVKTFTPYASVMLGKDVFSVGGGVTIKEKHGIGIEYLNLGGKSAIGYKYIYNF